MSSSLQSLGIVGNEGRVEVGGGGDEEGGNQGGGQQNTANTATSRGTAPLMYSDGRLIPQHTASPATYAAEGRLINMWPMGTEYKCTLGAQRELLVRSDEARSGELVQISVEFQEGSECERFVGRLGRLTQQYGDHFWGAFFEGERREEVFHAGQGIYMLAYAHPEGSKEILNDLQPPPTNKFGKILNFAALPPENPELGESGF